MKRTIVLLLAVVALVVSACGSDETEATATPIPTPATTPTEEPTAESTETPEPTETPEGTDDGDDDTGSVIDGELVDVLPEQLGGFDRTVVPGLDELIAPMLEQQGIDADEADFAFASYGEGSDALVVTAMRMPGLDQAQLEMLARLMSSGQLGAGPEMEAETVTIGGKEVLEVTPEGQEGSVYIYFAGDAFFSIVGPSRELAEELLSELP